VDTDLDSAHTDDTVPRPRPVPAGCAESDADWLRYLQHDAPGGPLLAGNAMTRQLTSGRPIHLMHTTTALDAIRASGQLYASSGCLVAALYCAPLTPTAAGLRPHNLGAYLLQTKPHTRTLVIEITPPPRFRPGALTTCDSAASTCAPTSTFAASSPWPRTPGCAGGQCTRSVRQPRSWTQSWPTPPGAGRRTPPEAFVDQFAAAVEYLPFLGYMYFEVLSEYLMLHSTSAETKTYADAGEMNNRLYKRLAFSAVSGMDKLFDLSRFRPPAQRLQALIADIEPRLAPGAAQYTRDRLSHLFTAVALNHDQDFDSLARTAPSLLGQALFREMRILERYPQLYLAFE
jgi:hypothetical protein